MTNIFSVLNMGVRSLAAQQTAVNVVGHNIANINTPNYTRQYAFLSASYPGQEGLLQIGTGAEVTSIVQFRDNYSIAKVNQHTGLLAYSTRKYSSLSEIEASLVSVSSLNLGDAMTDFWQGFEDVGNTPEGAAERQNLMQTGQELARSIRNQYSTFRSQRSMLNDEVVQTTQQINQLVSEIAALNAGIASGASDAQLPQANDLIDRRSEALDQLAELIDFTMFEDEQGCVTVLAGNNRVLVSKDRYNELLLRNNTSNNGYYDVYWTDGYTQENITSHIKGGKLGANLEARDELIVSYMEDLDELAASLIESINKSHSMGYAQSARNSAVGCYSVASSTIALNDAFNVDGSHLAYSSEEGAFKIEITSNGETVQTVTINVNPNTDSLQDIVDAINSSTTYLTASISQNKLMITGNGGHEFVLGEDEGGVLAQLGLNVFYSGFDAQTMDVADVIVNDPSLIAAGASFAPGDGGNALSLTLLADELVLSGGTCTFAEYFNTMVARAGNETAAADFMVKQEQDNLDFYQNLRDQASGVSIDEELANLVMYQQAYNSAAHFISVVNSMIDSMLNTLGS